RKTRASLPPSAETPNERLRRSRPRDVRPQPGVGASPRCVVSDGSNHLGWSRKPRSAGAEHPEGLGELRTCLLPRLGEPLPDEGADLFRIADLRAMGVQRLDLHLDRVA